MKLRLVLWVMQSVIMRDGLIAVLSDWKLQAAIR